MTETGGVSSLEDVKTRDGIRFLHRGGPRLLGPFHLAAGFDKAVMTPEMVMLDAIDPDVMDFQARPSERMVGRHYVMKSRMLRMINQVYALQNWREFNAGRRQGGS